MFDEGFDFHLIQKRKIESADVICEYHYSFYTSKKRYVGLVEEYSQNVFAVKFYPASFKNNNNRFNLIVDDFEAPKVIRTSVNIMLSILAGRPEASFAWVGSHTKMKSKHETKTNTQRFRIYKYVMLNFFSEQDWFHYDDYRTSTYLLVNKQVGDVETYVKCTVKMFGNIYPELETL